MDISINWIGYINTAKQVFITKIYFYLNLKPFKNIFVVVNFYQFLCIIHAKSTIQFFSGKMSSETEKIKKTKSFWNRYKLNCKINGTVNIFFLKKSYLSPRWTKLPQFFSMGVFPSYFHVISDFCHIWAPFMAKIEKNVSKKCFSACPRFWVHPGSGCVSEQMVGMTARFKFCLGPNICWQ